MFKSKKLGTHSRLIAIIYVYSTFNNTLITITNIDGKVLTFGATGFLNIKGSKRSTAFAGQNIATVLAKKLTNLGIKFLQLKFKGFGISRKSVLKGFSTYNFTILSIKHLQLSAHNGCRQKKKRRI